jgi:hypothetical protein
VERWRSGGVVDVTPVLVLRGVHQSGVNCLSVAELPPLPGWPSVFSSDAEQDAFCPFVSKAALERTYVVASGGDDQSTHVALVTVVRTDSTLKPEVRNLPSARLVAEGHKELTHSSSLKGA